MQKSRLTNFQTSNSKRIAKLIRRQREGGKLTRAERATVDNYRKAKMESREWVSRAALAAQIRCHPNTLTRWIRESGIGHAEVVRFKRVNGQWNPKRFREFMVKHDLKPDDREGAGGMSTGAHSKLAEVRLDIEIEKLHRLRRENQIQGGQMYRRANVDTWQATLADGIKAILTQRLLAEFPPKLVGLDAAAIAGVMEILIAEIGELFRGKPQRG